MKLAADLSLRLQFLARVVDKECTHLETTDQRLFATPFTLERAGELDKDPDSAERVDAFVGRFGRLQDTSGDKLLPALLAALGEKRGPMIDNLDRAERLGLIASADTWLAMRSLRNQMIHEYVEDPKVLVTAIQSGHQYVPVLLEAARNMVKEIERRGWA